MTDDVIDKRAVRRSFEHMTVNLFHDTARVRRARLLGRGEGRHERQRADEYSSTQHDNLLSP